MGRIGSTSSSSNSRGFMACALFMVLVGFAALNAVWRKQASTIDSDAAQQLRRTMTLPPTTTAPTTAVPTEYPTKKPTTTAYPTRRPTHPTYCRDVPGLRKSRIPQQQYSSPTRVTNIVVAVVASHPRQNQTLPAIQQTWGAQFEHIDYYSSTSLPGLVTKVVPTNKTYARASQEDLHALRMMLEKHPHAEWYMKTDDDAFVNVPQLVEDLKRFPADQDWYLGQPLWFTPQQVNGTHQPQRVHYCAGGAGSLWSNSMMRKLVGALGHNNKLEYCCSDVEFGRVLQGVLGRNETCTWLAPYVLGSGLYRSMDKEMRLLGMHNGSMRPTALSVALPSISLMHYVAAEMQHVYFAMFNAMRECTKGRRDTSSSSLSIVVPAYSQWDTKPCASDVEFELACSNDSQVVVSV